MKTFKDWDSFDWWATASIIGIAIVFGILGIVALVMP